MKFGQLILRRIIKIVATKCQILRLKCTKIDFGWGSTQTPLGSLQHSPEPLAGFKGPYFEGKGDIGSEGKGERKGRQGDGEGRVRDGRKGEGRGGDPACVS